MKKLSLILCVFLFFNSCSKTNTEKENFENCINFNWYSSKMGGKKYKRAALFIPVKIDTLKYTYKMQLDTGAPWNIFYGGVISNIIQHFPYLKNEVSKVDTAYFTRFKAPITMGANNSNIEVKSGHYYPNIGKKDLKNSTNKKYKRGKMGAIGLMGVEQFLNKVLIIDFKNQKICIQNSLNKKELNKEYVFTNFKLLEFNRIVLELKIGNEPVKVLYDTGSSIISIATFDKKKFNQLRANTTSTLDSFAGETFGTGQSKTYIGELGKNIYFDNIQLNNKDGNVYLGAYKGLQALSKKTGVSYLIGNKFFFGRTVIIDFKNHKLGISKE